MKINNLISFLILISFLTASTYNNLLISSDDYITGEDGVVRMYINVIGNVKNPGTHLVYDGIDIMSLLAIAGGFLPGSNLTNITILTKDGKHKKINLKKAIEDEESFNSLIKLKPNDTIYIKETAFSSIIRSSNLPSIMLSFLNIILTITRYS
tara:strand:- start:83 stop:541 length:459 start_codon:yes stop_codon:yes gene_type:complete